MYGKVPWMTAIEIGLYLLGNEMRLNMFNQVTIITKAVLGTLALAAHSGLKANGSRRGRWEKTFPGEIWGKNESIKTVAVRTDARDFIKNLQELDSGSI